MFQPMQETRQGAGIVVGGGVAFVFHGQIQERIQVLLPLGCANVVRPPSGDDAADVHFVEHASDDFHRRTQGAVGTHFRQALQDRMGFFAPGAGLAIVLQPAQPFGQPLLRFLAIGQRHDLGGGQGVGAVGNATQAALGQCHLGGGQQTGERHFHGHVHLAQRPSDGIDASVGTRQHGNVAVAYRARVAASRIDDVVALGDELRHAQRDAASALRHIAG